MSIILFIAGINNDSDNVVSNKKLLLRFQYAMFTIYKKIDYNISIICLSDNQCVIV